MRILVTGAAGFIGSHLAERLVREGQQVVGVDAFTDFYPRAIKERNLAWLRQQPNFSLVEGDLLALDLAALLPGVSHVVHLAAQAGVRSSWGSQFQTYVNANVLATQRLLEAAKEASLRRFVYASSSSIYGEAETLPTPETATPHPLSPYGVTKLAGEHLCRLYWRNYGVPTVMLRYFSVYGPRQRPDMAFARLIQAIHNGATFTVYGDGRQTRDFTYVDDVVAATLLALGAPVEGVVFNIGGGARTSLQEVIQTLAQIAGREPNLAFAPVQSGDVRDTAADISKAKAILGYGPAVAISEGLRKQLEVYKAG